MDVLFAEKTRKPGGRRNARSSLPFFLPIAAFALAIAAGTLLLRLKVAAAGAPTGWVDALFMATSAVCVTGLASVDPATHFSSFGHCVLLALMQLGGVGILTYTTLLFFLLRRRISLTDKLAAGAPLLHDGSLHLGKFIQRTLAIVFFIEFLGAALLYALEPERMGAFKALFLSVSAFCNAGFALWPDSLMQWKRSPGVNAVVMALIISGGLGFAVLDECLSAFRMRLSRLVGARRRGRDRAAPPLARLSYHARLVLRTSCFLVAAGAVLLLIPEFFANDEDLSSLGELMLPSLFHSVSARTAGLNTVDVCRLTDVSLLTLIFLMLIGGSPGSCAGGIKTTTFRTVLAFIAAQFRRRPQAVAAGKALSAASISQAFVLTAFSCLIVGCGTLALAWCEGGANPHGKTPFQALDIFFEAVSAFATVGLSLNVTPQLSPGGKLIDCALMFIGRLGPVCFITLIRQFHSEPRFHFPETDLPIG